MNQRHPDDLAGAAAYLSRLQDGLCAALEAQDGVARFREEAWTRPEGGGGRTRVLERGAVFEKAGVGLSRVRGDRLPPAATTRRPELAGQAWEALGVSAVIHPLNPYAPTAHLNVRIFSVAGGTFWMGGGFDLTPFYGFAEDAVHWHRAARAAVEPFGAGLHGRFKSNCDEYFFLRHRGEARGIGGIFFDDFDELGFAGGFALVRAVGDAFAGAYLPIVARRQGMPFGERERRFQEYRRGRYVEFNLVWDRGTLFGLQSGGRTESILMSLPPVARWDYGWQAEPGSPEDLLVADYLQPRDWLKSV